MSAIQQLANVIAKAVRDANSTVGAAERAVVSGETVVTNHGAYAYDCICPVNLYDGKEVYIQVLADKSMAVIIGD